ncbi:MAG: phage virion morphogenesis protein [Treponema sp.]|nr:phage virion morphogenesis protein [Treponema sp.]
MLTFDLRELDAVRKRRIEAAALTYEDRGKLLGAIGVEIETQTQDRFDTKIDPDGKQWTPLAEATENYYRRAMARGGLSGVPRPTLLVSGDLRDSIVSQVQGGNWSVVAGTVLEYANVHQYGYKNIPARPFIGLSTNDVQEIDEIIEKFLARTFKW